MESAIKKFKVLNKKVCFYEKLVIFREKRSQVKLMVGLNHYTTLFPYLKTLKRPKQISLSGLISRATINRGVREFVPIS
tara:strand:+ start:14612 stop:14848 length:237 start_codon:yes stop_codon:yes gene_type:complete